MRSFGHWTPRYLWDRARLYAYEWTHRDAPWLTPHATRHLDAWLQEDHVGFEWGAGRSTLWFAQRVGRLTSVETDQQWFNKVRDSLEAQSQSNVRLLHDDGTTESHPKAVDVEQDDSLDFVLVDGNPEDRAECALRALPKIRPGGLLIIDDIHRYLPSDTRSPLALGNSPTGATPQWAELKAKLQHWPCLWTTSGVTDTAIWTRPA